MANTVIQLKKSATPSATPSSLANGEIAINYADGKLFYKAANGTIVQFSQGGNSFSTVNANGTLIVAGSGSDILTIAPGSGINIVGDAITEKITISTSSTATGGGGYYAGNNGDKNPSNFGDIFRMHSNTLSQNVTIYSGNNAIAAGPITVSGAATTLTIQTGARLVIS